MSDDFWALDCAAMELRLLAHAIDAAKPSPEDRLVTIVGVGDPAPGRGRCVRDEHARRDPRTAADGRDHGAPRVERPPKLKKSNPGITPRAQAKGFRR